MQPAMAMGGDSASDTAPSSSTRVRAAATRAMTSAEFVAAASRVKPSSTGPGATAAPGPDAAAAAAVPPRGPAAAAVRSGSGGDAAWTVDETTTLVRHVRDVFQPAFDASAIFSLLPARSEACIRRKWCALSSALLAASPKRTRAEADESDGGASADTIITPPRKKTQGRAWTDADLERLTEVMLEVAAATTPKWDQIARSFPGRTPVDCLAQWQSMSVPQQVKGKGSWTPAEDAVLRARYLLCGNKWSKIAELLPGRSGKQCRERFVNHLDPHLKKCEWSDDEEAILIGMHHHHGNKWTLISKNLPGRSDNDVKNHWYSTITRKFQVHGKEKLTVAAIQQVFMLVTAGVVSRDLVRDWPGAPVAPAPLPLAYQYWYGHSVSPEGYHSRPLPPARPAPHPPPQRSHWNPKPGEG